MPVSIGKPSSEAQSSKPERGEELERLHDDDEGDAIDMSTLVPATAQVASAAIPDSEEHEEAATAAAHALLDAAMGGDADVKEAVLTSNADVVHEASAPNEHEGNSTAEDGMTIGDESDDEEMPPKREVPKDTRRYSDSPELPPLGRDASFRAFDESDVPSTLSRFPAPYADDDEESSAKRYLANPQALAQSLD